VTESTACSCPAQDGKDPRWQSVHDRFREANAAVMGRIDVPRDSTALALLEASSAALRAFGEVYEQSAKSAMLGQIEGSGSEGSGSEGSGSEGSGSEGSGSEGSGSEGSGSEGFAGKLGE